MSTPVTSECHKEIHVTPMGLHWASTQPRTSAKQGGYYGYPGPSTTDALWSRPGIAGVLKQKFLNTLGFKHVGFYAQLFIPRKMCCFPANVKSLCLEEMKKIQTF